MKKIIILFTVLLSSFSIYSQENNEQNDEVTTYYLIRHAEKKTNQKDPGINNDGIKRSKNWVKVFKNVSFDAIYSTDFKRTKQTAKFIADSKKLTIFGYDAKDVYSDSFKYNTKGKTVLIVGHSNTTPNLVNKILGKEKYQQIDEKTFGNLYIVTVMGKKVSANLLSIE